ncbi:DUF4350 domain-containing protein [Sporichthya polymorpha]|uniref:DUF4350 domain-containing protein n=1 Tax=Sporichthya polymorpha TaxID=35751 RepID=UPI0003628F73|nr:DUF4350 domain-containing protein [Sporichthya polymorpha]
MSDTATVETAAPASTPETTSAAPGARTVWQSVRVPVLAVTVLLLVSVGLAVLAGRGATGELDAESYEPAGSRAIVALLRDEGVTVHVARTVAEARAAAEGATVLVTHPALLPPDRLTAVTTDAAGVVLVQPTSAALEAVGSDLVPLVKDDVEDRDPGCTLPPAQRAGRAEVGGVEYGRFAPRPDAPPAVLCYPRAEQERIPSAPLAREGRVTALGAGNFLTNDRLDSDGNAALALGLLGERADLVWFRPSLDDPALEGGSKPLHVLLPDSVKVALLQLAIAALVVAAWRARRLGPVVAEPLPVVVRAAEATEGLARLYRRAEARHRAATSLRDAAVRSIAPRFGLPPVGADPRTVTEAVARHTGRPSPEIGELLYGEAPDDDAALVDLADSLDTLAAQLRDGKPREGHPPKGTP